jgi:ribosomal protein S18 acetylase RimI-like enzyme
MSQPIYVRPVTEEDREWLAQFIRIRWGSNRVVVHSNLYFPHTLSGLLALRGDEIVGALTYHTVDDHLEIITIDSTEPNKGIGTQLLVTLEEQARHAGIRRFSVTTTNDNLEALRFYQKRGFRLVAVHPGAVEQARQLKPEIPLVGNDGIPIRDEVELERLLA